MVCLGDLADELGTYASCDPSMALGCAISGADCRRASRVPVDIAGEKNASSDSAMHVELTPNKCVNDSRYVAIVDAMLGGNDRCIAR